MYFQVEAADVGDRGVIAVLVPGTDAGVADLLKQTWTTGEQRAHVHIHHKTILYIDIGASSPGRKVRVSGGGGGDGAALRKDQDRTAMAKRGGLERVRI